MAERAIKQQLETLKISKKLQAKNTHRHDNYKFKNQKNYGKQLGHSGHICIGYRLKYLELLVFIFLLHLSQKKMADL